VNQIVH